MVEHESLHLPIFRHERDAFFDRLDRASHLLRNIVEPEFASDDRTESEDRLQDFRATATNQTGKTVNFPFHEREVDAMQAIVDDTR